MTRTAETILPSSYGLARGSQAAMVDPRRGGMMGYAPDYTSWISNQQYIRKPLIPYLIAAPTGFQMLPDPDSWVGILKAMVELHPVRITGLNAGLEVETTTTPVGGAGQVQEDPTDVKQVTSNITFGWNEKVGMPFQSFLRDWIQYLIMNAESKYATINTLPGRRLTDMLADRYAMTMLFVEPDANHNRVLKSWLVANMYPKATGEIIGARDLNSPGEASNIDISFTGLVQTGRGVNLFAQRMMDAINITGADPYNRAAFADRIAADVARQQVGYENQVETLGAGAVRI